MTYTYTYQTVGQRGKTDRYLLLSASPRRRELLAFLKPEIQSVDIDERAIQEHFMAQFAADDFLTRAAKVCCEISKAKSDIDLPEGTLAISADTIVVFDDQIYNKPENEMEARQMFLSYFGRSHQVVTSVCLRAQDYLDVFYTVADIQFADYYEVLAEPIEAYLASGSPMDKAGAYGFQDLDPRFIKSIAGDPNTIIGLPVAELSQRLFVANA